jgi:hypothetical protein
MKYRVYYSAVASSSVEVEADDANEAREKAEDAFAFPSICAQHGPQRVGAGRVRRRRHGGGLVSTRIHHEEHIGTVWLRSNEVQVTVGREATLSEDLTEVTGHVCQDIRLQIRINGVWTEAKATPGEASDLIGLLQQAIGAWTEPMEAES